MAEKIRKKKETSESPSIKVRLRKLTQPAREAYDAARCKSELLRQSLEFFVRLNKAVSIADIDKREIADMVTRQVLDELKGILDKPHPSALPDKTQTEIVKENEIDEKDGNTSDNDIINESNKELYLNLANFGRSLSAQLHKEEKK